MDQEMKFMEIQGDAGQARLQEQFSEQVEDASLPAEQILAEQQETHGNDGGAPRFVP